VKDPVKFPDNMSPEFKSFLQGLLNKTPSERLSWPELLQHPFVSETDQEKKDRKIRHEFYTNWAANEHHSGGQQNMNEVMESTDTDPASTTPNIDILEDLLSNRHLPNYKFDAYPKLAEEDDPMGSPRIKDAEWSAYENQSKNETGAS
jgi:fused-like protein